MPKKLSHCDERITSANLLDTARLHGRLAGLVDAIKAIQYAKNRTDAALRLMFEAERIRRVLGI
jgi:hypothetical protein